MIDFAVREYKHIILKIDESVTLIELKDRLRNRILTEGIEHIYKVVLEGYRNSQAYFDEKYLKTAGNIVEIIDTTKVMYRYEKLIKEHENDLIGFYIREFMKDGVIDGEDKALQYGIMALLGDGL